MQLLLPAAYFPPTTFLGAAACAGSVVVEQYDHYQKQTYRNRAVIGTATGPLQLTIPVEKGAVPKQHTKDVRISSHSDWRTAHKHALKTAYMGSPFFEYYMDDIFQLLDREWDFLMDLNMATFELLSTLMGLDAPVSRSDCYEKSPSAEVNDLRLLIDPAVRFPKELCPQPYYQTFATKRGFLENLSSLDLLFNMGPESILVLKR